MCVYYYILCIILYYHVLYYLSYPYMKSNAQFTSSQELQRLGTSVVKRKRRCSCKHVNIVHHVAKILCGWWSDPPSHAPSGTSQSTSCTGQRRDPGHDDSRSQGSGQDCWPVRSGQDPVNSNLDVSISFSQLATWNWCAKYCEVAPLMAERTVISAVQKCALSDLVHQPRDSHYNYHIYHILGSNWQRWSQFGCSAPTLMKPKGPKMSLRMWKVKIRGATLMRKDRTWLRRFSTSDAGSSEIPEDRWLYCRL